MKTVLLTGANSLLGTNVIIELLQNGFKVNALLRDKSRFFFKSLENLNLIEGSFTDPAIVKQALNGCDYVIHTAAITDQNLSRYSDYDKINVKASVKLLQQAIHAKVKRFVYVGSANAFGYGNIERPGNEKTPICEPFINSPYALSKHRAQKQLLAYKDQIEIIVMNPSFMIGPYDAKPSSGRIIMMAYGRKLIFSPPGGKNFVHVQDVAKAVVQSFDHAIPGEAYLITNENLSYIDFFKKLSAISNTNSVIIKLPVWILYLAGIAGNLLRLVGIRTSLSLTNMKILSIDGFYDNNKAANTFEISFQSSDQAICDAVDWFKEQGRL